MVTNDHSQCLRYDTVVLPHCNRSTPTTDCAKFPQAIWLQMAAKRA